MLNSICPLCGSWRTQTVYLKSCKMCHGTDGKGNAKLAVVLKVTLAQLNLVKDETQNKSDADLKKTIKDGTGKMKPMGGKLSDNEIAATVAHLRRLAKGK